VKQLSGTTLSSVRIAFVQGKEKYVKEGNILFTHFGLSGPLILNSAHKVKDMLLKGVVTAYIDLFPKDDVGALRAKFQKLCEENGNKSLHNALKVWFPKGVVEAILVSFPQDSADSKVNGLAREMRHALVDRMKSISITVTGTMGYDWAIVSDGGVDLKEVDTKTMQSKLHSNLYFVGDVLHINRPSGGYSLQLCWTTGWVAGNSIPLNTNKSTSPKGK
jgi:predicted Rossmann fold flavoprotein